MATVGDLSARGRSNVELIMPMISKLIAEKQRSQDITIDLSTAENWLIRNELIDIFKAAIAENLIPRVFQFSTLLSLYFPSAVRVVWVSEYVTYESTANLAPILSKRSLRRYITP